MDQVIAYTPAKVQGFTLLEILIALFIFVIIGALSTVGLFTILTAHTQTEMHAQQLTQLQMAIAIMGRDIQQIAPRPIINALGQTEAAVVASPATLNFTHAGFINPLAVDSRSNLQRVAYLVANAQLIRKTWPVLDQDTTTQPEQRVLLDGVTDFQINLLDDQAETQTNWPLSSTSPEQALVQLPTAILIQLKAKPWGTIKRVFSVPG